MVVVTIPSCQTSLQIYGDPFARAIVVEGVEFRVNLRTK